MVQCRTLYSIALFWNNYKDESKREMDAAVRLALDLQMFRQDFAAKQGSQDAVLTECWRRTWWTLYMVDAFYAGTLGTMNFATVDVVATVDLPSEEWEYEEGVSSPPPSAAFQSDRHPFFLAMSVSHCFSTND
jgi:cbb3-type cytochrome oxidase subunit 3